MSLHEPDPSEVLTGVGTADIELESETPTNAPFYIREQYHIRERKKLVVTAVAGATGNQYLVSTKDAAVVMITTDSVIQYDTTDISADSPQMAGSASTYDRVTLGIYRLPLPRILYFQLVSGNGNVWLLIGD